MAELVTFGETMVVFSPDAVGPFRHSTGFRRSIGGAESNLAIGVARLGRTVTWVSKVSADPMGDAILTALRGEGVDLSWARRVEGNFTGVIIKERPALGDPHVFYYRRGSAASAMTPDDFPPEALEGARIMHATGITPALSSSCRELTFHAFALAREAGVTVSFDPNMRRKLWTEAEARPVLLSLAGQCDILMPGLDEAELLVGPGTAEAMAARLLALGPQIVVIKLGPEGALVAGGDLPGPVRVAGMPLTPVDTVGAGDAFGAAFLGSLLWGRSPVEAARYGCVAGAVTTQVVGDWEGFPSAEQLDRLVRGQGGVAR